MVLFRPTVVLRRPISSFGFSGAGFLACYHLGVAQCLLDHKILQSSTELVGVSAGALISAALIANVNLEDGMQAVLEISRTTRRHRLDALQPGYSLIDVVDRYFGNMIEKAADDPEHFLKQANQYLRVGLTDRRVFPPIGPNERAFCYVNEFRSVQDVIAACILSSYIPGITGPAWGSLDSRHSAVLRASRRFHKMIQDGCVKEGLTGEPIRILSRNYTREVGWDGGLVNAFPFIDKHTVIVTPLAATFSHASISPAIAYATTTTPVRTWQLNARVRLHLTAENLTAFRCITLSSDDDVLQDKFTQGYDNCRLFLDKNNLLSVYQSSVPPEYQHGEDEKSSVAGT